MQFMKKEAAVNFLQFYTLAGKAMLGLLNKFSNYFLQTI